MTNPSHLIVNARSETPQTFHYVEARANVPLKQDFKPAVTVLSRRPQNATQNNGRNSNKLNIANGEGISGLSISGGGANLSDSDEDGSNKPPELTPEERQAKALRDREEKQRKYEEARERLFGNSSAPGSGASSPGGTPSPSRNKDRDSGIDSGSSRNNGRGKARGHGGKDRDNSHNNRDRRDSTTNKQRQLYDPGYSVKPSTNTASTQRRALQPAVDRPDGEQQQHSIRPTRNPRGPDGSGRGGSGFTSRGRGVLISREMST